MGTLGRRLYAIALSPILLMPATKGSAEQFYFEPSIDLRALYDDNIGLTTSSPESSGLIVASVAANTGRRSRVMDMGVNAKVTRRQYSSVPIRNTTDVALDANVAKTTRLDRIELDAKLDLDSTTTSELTTSGLTAAAKRRVRWQLAPSWRRQLTRQWGFTANVSYQDVSYKDAALTGLVDYTYLTSDVTTDYQLDQRLQLLGQLSFSRYKADQASSQSDTTGVLAGAGYSFSPTWSVRGLLGLRQTDTSSGATRSSSTGYLADITSTRQFQTGILTVGLNQSTTPSGAGGLLDSQHVSVDWNQRLTERWGWRFRLDRYLNERSAGAAGTSNRTYLIVSPSVQYRLDREWAVGAAYRYRNKELDNTAGSATSNAVIMTLSYRPLTRK